MIPQQKQNSDCPDHETLSAWFDGEAELTPEQKKHIRSCPECRAFVQWCYALGPAVSHATDNAYNGETAERILSGTRRMIVRQMDLPPVRKKHSRFLRPAWLLRYAVLLLCGTALLWLLLSDRSHAVTPAANASLPRIPVRTEMASILPSAAFLSYRTPSASTYTNNPLEQNMQGELFGVYDENGSFGINAPGFVDTVVRQVWFSPSFPSEDLKKHLNSLSGDLKIAAPEIRTMDRSLIFRATMNARQAAVLVKELHSWGLVTTARRAPLPDQNFFCGKGCEKLDLELFLIAANEDPLIHAVLR